MKSMFFVLRVSSGSHRGLDVTICDHVLTSRRPRDDAARSWAFAGLYLVTCDQNWASERPSGAPVVAGPGRDLDETRCGSRSGHV